MTTATTARRTRVRTGRITSDLLERIEGDPGNRYEIIDGVLYVSTMPHWNHQVVSKNAVHALAAWDPHDAHGQVAATPGLVFANDDDVAPDVVWASNERIVAAMDAAGHLTLAPELVLEVLSWGTVNVRRDREAKLALYGRRGVLEYWIADWRTKQLDVYRRRGDSLELVASLGEGDTLESPLLPGFTLPVANLFRGLIPT